MDYRREYKRLRKEGWLAAGALTQAKTKAKFEQMEADGLVRLRIEQDEFVDLEFLLGDTYRPECHPDIPASLIERQKQDEIKRINTEGVWGIIGEYRTATGWEHADSVWGFVGGDWKDSGYDSDIMAGAIEAARKQSYCVNCHRLVVAQ